MLHIDAYPSLLNKVVADILTYWKNLHQIQHHMKIFYSFDSLRTQDTIFDAIEFQ